MAEILLHYYKFVSDEVGYTGKVQLAIETKIPSSLAAITPDTPDVIEKFKQAVKKITGKMPPDLKK
jgi:hypothetical protein